MVNRTTRAVSYIHDRFQGTDLISAAAGQAKVESKRGALEIQVEFSGQAHEFWQRIPDVRVMGNFSGMPASEYRRGIWGDNHRSKLDVTTDLQARVLVVTAEPYYDGETWRKLRSDTSF